MSNLQDFVSEYSGKNSALRIPGSRKPLPKGRYIALALVPKNLLPDIGSATEFTLPGGGSATKITTANIVSTLVTLALHSQAWFFGNHTVSGLRGKPTEMKESAVFGTRTEALGTGEIREQMDFLFKYFFLNREFFNELRANYSEYDLYVFTDRSVEVIRYDLDEPMFLNIGDEVSGDINTSVIGGFSIIFSREGQIIPSFGKFETQLSASNARFTFGAGSATGLTLVVGTNKPYVYTMATGTGGSITRAVATGSGVTYAIFTGDGEPIPTGQPVTIATGTGVITVGNALPAGTYRYKVLASNSTGVMGEYEIEIRVA
ncbi:hypothetical protein [Tellurirhabdus bombi]|uniref:hypothetical protein n=1 Tax=Tellurirhabdus bombi TaxID=2907205 RepID=UPI001F2B9A88|nr:hypothetical protein [Tellurirhabdus bombi]